MTQGGLASLTLFNVTVDSVVSHWVLLTVDEDSAAHEGLGMTLGWFMGVFYSDDGMIRSRDPEWFQGDINFLIRILRIVGLMANVIKSKTINCQPGVIVTGMSEEAFNCMIK